MPFGRLSAKPRSLTTSEPSSPGSASSAVIKTQRLITSWPQRSAAISSRGRQLQNQQVRVTIGIGAHQSSFSNDLRRYSPYSQFANAARLMFCFAYSRAALPAWLPWSLAQGREPRGPLPFTSYHRHSDEVILRLDHTSLDSDALLRRSKVRAAPSSSIHAVLRIRYVAPD